MIIRKTMISALMGVTMIPASGFAQQAPGTNDPDQWIIEEDGQRTRRPDAPRRPGGERPPQQGEQGQRPGGPQGERPQRPEGQQPPQGQQQPPQGQRPQQPPQGGERPQRPDGPPQGERPQQPPQGQRPQQPPQEGQRPQRPPEGQRPPQQGEQRPQPPQGQQRPDRGPPQQGQQRPRDMDGPGRPGDFGRGPGREGPPPMRGPGMDGPPPIRRPPPMREAPSRDVIIRELERGPAIRVAPRDRVTIQEFKRRPELRQAAPSIDIQAINFATGSAEIPGSQFDKVEQIAEAMNFILRRNPDEVFLIEGHTDAVGSFASNQTLSEARASSLARILTREFGIPRRALETVGYGEEFLLVNTQSEDWRNRRVTIRRTGDFVR